MYLECTRRNTCQPAGRLRTALSYHQPAAQLLHPNACSSIREITFRSAANEIPFEIPLARLWRNQNPEYETCNSILRSSRFQSPIRSDAALLGYRQSCGTSRLGSVVQTSYMHDVYSALYLCILAQLTTC